MIAERVQRIQPSFTLEMTARAADLRNNGVDVIDLGVGEPDFNTPENIRQAVIQSTHPEEEQWNFAKRSAKN